MVLRLADQLALPLRERNAMLLAAGFAPLYAERALDDPALAAARRAIDLVLKGHEPWPAVAIDRHRHLIAANAAIKPLLAGCAAHLLEGPINVLRLSLHPEGLAPRILNLAEWRAHLLERLRRAGDDDWRFRARGAGRRAGGLSLSGRSGGRRRTWAGSRSRCGSPRRWANSA